MSFPLVQAGWYLENSVHRRREDNSLPISLTFIGQVKLNNSIIPLSKSVLQKVAKCAHYMISFSEHANKPTRALKRWNFFKIQVFWDVTLCHWPQRHKVASQKTWIFSNIAVGTSNIAWNFLTSCVITHSLSHSSGTLTLSVRTEYIYSAASQATSPDGVYILRDFHKVVKWPGTVDFKF
jgi:hypothetical protein